MGWKGLHTVRVVVRSCACVDRVKGECASDASV